MEKPSKIFEELMSSKSILEVASQISDRTVLFLESFAIFFQKLCKSSTSLSDMSSTASEALSVFQYKVVESEGHKCSKKITAGIMFVTQQSNASSVNKCAK